jgi:hypothetical protein
MIVIDVGCATHGSDSSIPHLIEEFSPRILYGFDPALAENTPVTTEGSTRVVLARSAAWTYDGEIGFHVNGLGGHVVRGGKAFPCVDLAAFILSMPEGEEIVLKMDAEGAEYVLLPHLVEHDADLRLKLAWIEWHCEECKLGGNGRHREGCATDRDWWFERREKAESALRCETTEWNL